MKLLPILHLVLLLVFLAIGTKAQEIFQPYSRSQALANSTVCLSGCWSVFGNQAGLAQIANPEVGGSYQSRFLVNELSARAGLFVLPVQSSVFAASFYQFGSSPFRNEKFGIAYARQISPHLSFGLQFSYYRLFFFEDNQFAGSSGLELGVQCQVSEKLIAGLHILNPYQTQIETISGDYRYPSAINGGVLFHLSDSFSLTSEIEHDLIHHFTFRNGFEYSLNDKLFLRAGIFGKPYQLTSGVGFKLKKLTIDIADSYHQYLGSSPAVSFQYQF